MKKWKCCLTAIVIAAGSMLVGCQESSSAKPIEAMYIPAGEDGHLMVGEGTGNVFTVTMPDNIQDKNGKKISEEDLNRGDIVAIYGDEIMLESYPGQYPGVTKIKVVKEGKASDADQYQDILDEFWPEKDPGELPYLNIGYCASYGEVSAAATRGGYSWSYADKDGVEQMRKLFLSFKEEGKTLLLASHNREDIELLCDEVYEMEHGRLHKLER